MTNEGGRLRAHAPAVRGHSGSDAGRVLAQLVVELGEQLRQRRLCGLCRVDAFVAEQVRERAAYGGAERLRAFVAVAPQRRVERSRQLTVTGASAGHHNQEEA